MGIRPSKMCSKCHRTAALGSRYCTLHANTQAIADKMRKLSSELRKLYNTKMWRVITRNSVLTRDAQCTHLDNGIRCPFLSTDVHHIIEAQLWVAQGGDFYAEDNLVGLCHSHHSRITGSAHGWKRTQA